MLWDVEIHPAPTQPDREAERILKDAQAFGAGTVRAVRSARSFLIQSQELSRELMERMAETLLVDTVVESYGVRPLSRPETHSEPEAANNGSVLLNVLFKPGVTDNVAESTRFALNDLGFAVEAVAACRKYWVNADATAADLDLLAEKILANESIEHVIRGPLQLESLSVGSRYEFELVTVPLGGMDDERLMELSRSGQLFLDLAEMKTVQNYFADLGRDPTDAELETIAQTWSEHCSHKTLTGRIRYRDENGERLFENMLKETIFAATATIREQLGADDWCVSVFEDNAGIVRFDEQQCVCFKVETHNHPSALEPYGGANTGIGGVIRDPLGTGLGARPICNTDVFCFAPPNTPYDNLPPGVLHPKIVARGVVAGVRDYGNRMGIPTVNGAVFFDERYLGNPLVYCGNVALIPADKCRKHMQPGDLIVVVGGRTGRDGIHGATFSSAELTQQSETLSGGAVQIGNAIAEKMMADVILQARDRGLFTAITDCGAGGFSSAVGEMGRETGAEVWLDRAPLKYEGLSYTEIWISEAQERMVLAVPPDHWDDFHVLCAAEGVEATVIGRFTDTGRLVLKYREHQVADLSMNFLHKGRPQVVRDAIYESPAMLDTPSPSPLVGEGRGGGASSSTPSPRPNPPSSRERATSRCNEILEQILGSLNVCSKEWIIRQYDHEVQAGSVLKPLVGVANDGPSDAAVIRPDLTSKRGLVIACGMNPRYGDLDPYWMAASAIDEALRNCVAVGANPDRIAILDNFCWGNTDRPEVLGSLVRAAIGCHDTAVAFRTPFISGKDSLNNEFSFLDAAEHRQTVSIPPSLLISALGQIEDVEQAVSMDLKQPGNLVYLIGNTRNELGGSHYQEVSNQRSEVRGQKPFSREAAPAGQKSDWPSSAHSVPSTQYSVLAVPRVDLELAPRLFAAVHRAIRAELIRSCHDLSEGGLVVAAAEMAFAGGWGVELDLQSLAQQTGFGDETVLLFSESNTRFLVEVPETHRAAFEEALSGLPLVLLGRVAEHEQVRIHGLDGTPVIDAPWPALKAAWQRPLQWD